MSIKTDEELAAVSRNWTADLATRSGVAIHVRPAGGEDAAALRDFFEHVSADDLRFRFLGGLRHLGDDKIEAICKFDPPAYLSFLAFSGGALAAVATLGGDERQRKAEIALATRPEWKAHGVSWVLFEHAIRFAQAHGYAEVLSIEKADNWAAIQLEQDMGFRISLCDDDGGDVVASKVTQCS